jgi:hypothetical protein
MMGNIPSYSLYIASYLLKGLITIAVALILHVAVAHALSDAPPAPPKPQCLSCAPQVPMPAPCWICAGDWGTGEGP